MNLRSTLRIFQQNAYLRTLQTCLQCSKHSGYQGVFTTTGGVANINQWPLHSKRARLIDGKAVASLIETEVMEEIASMTARSGKRPPHLTAVLVGDDPASQTYVDNKIKACERSGITSDTVRLPREISEEALLRKVTLLNDDPGVDGILVQLPVPDHINELIVCNAVHPSKDVDGFHTVNMGRLYANEKSFVPATPAGIVELIRRYKIETFGKTAVVVGRSKNVGLPTAMLLHSDGAFPDCPGLDSTVIMCHRYTPPHVLKQMTLLADILVVAVGHQGLVTGDMVKDGVAVFDVGINVVESESGLKRKIVGDVDFESVAGKASLITPVPGGVGPMTVAMLLKNTVKAYRESFDSK